MEGRWRRVAALVLAACGGWAPPASSQSAAGRQRGGHAGFFGAQDREPATSELVVLLTPTG
jgi:hypothetical protein